MSPASKASGNPSIWDALREETPLQIVGATNAYHALLAQQAGFRAIYLSGAGVANASFGLPDLAMTTLDNVLEDARRILGAVTLPLLVDVDTGFGGPLMIERAIGLLDDTGVAAIHMEDQVAEKRCGHRPGKVLVETAEMLERLRAAQAGRRRKEFAIMARTDAVAVEGLPAAIERSLAYIDAGADMIFAEALTSPEDFRAFTQAVPVPVLANLTEFGKTPITSVDAMREVGVKLLLYPLSAFRAASLAAQRVFEAIRQEGSQESVLESMQARAELYQVLRYHEFEERLNAHLGNDK
ncbi:Methylisocitrate lyase [Planctomycetes bacterium Pan216]|uniref:Methylisocitrate lyase n=1 Tax=Kolteria novifilia TaxID=2527975 RepID=A0A518AX70_9BACT|nr:Methylisocitrate lyase [Planctomycetes bacterium Pan216]